MFGTFWQSAGLEEKAQKSTEMQKPRLNLNEEQAQQMYDLNLKYIAEMETIQAEGKSRSMMMKLKDMSGRRNAEVKAVLDKAQYKEYEQMQSERRAEMKKRMMEERGL